MALQKTLSKVVKKWQQVAASSMMGRTTKKGWFVVYTMDRRRYVLPLELLEMETFVWMLKRAEEEFGLSTHQPIVFPFDASVMDRIVQVLLVGEQPKQRPQGVLINVEQDEMIMVAAAAGGCSAESSSCLGYTQQMNVVSLG